MRTTLPIICLFLTGFAGLVYEVCCIREASVTFGGTTLAAATVIGVFFGGLALGSWLFGRLAPRAPRPLRVYALLELGAAAAALLTPFTFELIERLYGDLYRAAHGASPLVALARGGLVSLALLPATVLMGGTLPLFTQHWARRGAAPARAAGLLYGLNTLGAAAGCAATGLWLLPSIGVRGSFALGAALSALCGAAVLSLRIGPLAPPAPAERPGPGRAPGLQRTLVAALFFTTGLAALGTEVLWTRFLALVARNTVHTYTITLTVVLAGIVLGSLLAAWLLERSRGRPPSRARIFGALQVLTGLSVLALLLLPPALWRAVETQLLACIILMLVPAALSGASFPVAVRLVLDDPALAGLRVGVLLAVNTAGGLLGALVTGVVSLPVLGLGPTLRILTGLSVACGVFAWLLLEQRAARRAPALAASISAVALWLALPPLAGTRLPEDFLAQRGRLVDHLEGSAGTLAVIADGDVLRLEIDRWWQGEDRKNHQIMAAHVPALLHPGPRRVLVVGAGVGQTPGRFLMHGVARLDCVDIEPGVFDLVRRHFDAAWMDDERVRLVAEDGRSYLAHTGATYDIISIEVGQLFRPGVAAFYTADFYRIAAARLNQGGLLVQFVPLPFFTQDEFRSVVATFLQVLPGTVLWYNTSELLLIGRPSGPPQLQPDRLRAIEDDPAIHADLRYSHWGGQAQWLSRPAALAACFLCGPHGLAVLTRGAPVYRDDRPVLEYAASRAQPTDMREVPLAGLLRTHLDPIETVLAVELAPADRAAALALRDQNLADVIASAWLRQVDLLRDRLPREQILGLLAESLRHNPGNAAASRTMGDELVRAGRLVEAEPYFAASLGARPDDVPAHKGMAFVLIQTGRSAQALPHLRAAIERRPLDAETHNWLGVALAQTGDLPAAARAFERAVELDAGFEDARRNLAQAMQAIGQRSD